MKSYPRLKVALRTQPVLVTISRSHRHYEGRLMWTVYRVDRPGNETVMYVGCDDSVFGWTDALDYCHATIRMAQANQQGDQS